MSSEEEKAKQLQELIRQRNELDRMIEELSAEVKSSENNTTNIPFAPVFVTAHKAYRLTFMEQEPRLLLDHKMFVNKKCNQLSTNMEHTQRIFDEMLPRLQDHYFVEMLLCKLLDQGRILVTSHHDSFLPIAYIISQACVASKNQDIREILLRLAMRKSSKAGDVGGIYGVYFGTLKFLGDTAGAWNFLASVLNVQPSSQTGPVLEKFFEICGEMIFKYSRKRFRKISLYLENFFFKMLCNIGIETRIKTTMKKYLTQTN